MSFVRFRITFAKTGPLVFVGNLDLMTIWERAARRAGLPLRYSQGFHPQPKIQFAAPLPLGFASRCEVLDMQLEEGRECSHLLPVLQPVLPDGLTILGVEPVETRAPALATQLRATEYEVSFSSPPNAAELKGRIEALLASASLPRERRGRRYDLRPLIQGLELVEQKTSPGPVLWMRLMAMQGATGRPDEVLEVLGLSRENSRIERTALILERPPLGS